MSFVHKMFLFSVLIQSVTASPSQHHVVDPGPDGDLGGVGVAIGAVVADAVIDDSSVVVVLFFLVYFTSLRSCGWR